MHFLRSSFASLVLFGTLAAARLSAATVSPPAVPDPPDREARANIYIHDIIPYWQHRLQLEDWTISVLMSRRTDLRPGTLGNIHWDAEKKTATIRVLDASEYSTPYAATVKDMEFTIVHEMIHLELASLPISDANRSDEEYAINHLADALLQSAPDGAPGRPVH